jgi:SecD/SecF fusion protein
LPDFDVANRARPFSPRRDHGEVQRAITRIGGQVTELRDEFIGPTIGAGLRRKALIALGIGLLMQLGYLAIRFRWTFGAAAVVAMLHDVAILLGLFTWLGKPLDGVFLRIRERLRFRTREPLERLPNEACPQTIPRTVNTGLGRCSFMPVGLERQRLRQDRPGAL